jgi:hypothetical protein
MKRTVAFWGAVSVFFATTWATDVVAQEQKPVSASGDTLKAGAEQTAPGATQQQAPGQQQAPIAAADTMTAAARIKSAQQSPTTYTLSLGLGTTLNEDPPAFPDEYDAGFNFLLDFGARRWNLDVSLSFDYSFFFTTLQEPDDMNIMMLFLNVKYLFFHSTARPYVVVCGGWFRSWIVDDLDPNNPPQTVLYEVEGGDYQYTENVLGYGGGGGVEIEIDRVRRIFFDVRYIEGQTRQTQDHANMVLIPVRLGLTWEF